MSHPAAECIPLFPDEEIPFILRAVLRCGRLVKKKKIRELENQINDRLYLYLRRDSELRMRPVRPFREVSVYDNNNELDEDDAAESPIGRPDFSFYYPTTIGDWPYLAIECKRLHVTYQIGLRPLISEYVTGHQGIRCFIDQRYARGLTHGAMLGYVFDGQVDVARESIARSIKQHHVSLQAHHQGVMQPSALLIDEILETHHQIEDRLFILHHLLIPV